MSTTSIPQVYCLITGVSPGGLGDALTTELLARPNMHIIATGLQLHHLDHITAPSDRVTKLQLDVTSPASISSAVETVERLTNGTLNYLVNNAGYGYMMPLLDADIGAVRDNFEVNVLGLLAVTQAFFPLLRMAQGVVVNQCSIASMVGGRQPFIGSYCATKAAVASLNDHMRLEFAPFGVKVINLVTGDVATGFWTHTPAVQTGLPESSLYAPIRTHAERMIRGETNPSGGHSRERWAAAVARDMLKLHPRPFIRRGFLAWTMMMASLLFPRWLFDWVFTQTSKLGELKGIVQSEDVKKTV